MTTTHVELLNATRGEIEEQLTTGKSPAEVAQALQEPMPNVLQIFRDLRDNGRINAGNHLGGRAVPAPPQHRPDPALTSRIAATTDMLVHADKIDDKRIQSALSRARKALTDLAGLVEAYESKSAARNRIARLEAELRIARAELTGKPKSTSGAASEPTSMTDARRAALDKARAIASTPVDCPACGKTCNSKAGLASHSRNAHGSAA